MSKSFIVFQGGTLIIYGEKNDSTGLASSIQIDEERFRCGGYRYCDVQPHLLRARIFTINPHVGRRSILPLMIPVNHIRPSFSKTYCKPRNLDLARGSVVLPTALGRHFWLYGLLYVQSVSTAVVYQTIDILHRRWYQQEHSQQTL